MRDLGATICPTQDSSGQSAITQVPSADKVSGRDPEAVGTSWDMDSEEQPWDCRAVPVHQILVRDAPLREVQD